MSIKKFDISDKFPLRLRQAIEFLGFNKRKFALEIGVSPSFLGDVLNFKSGPSYGMIQGVALKFPSVNVHWLLTGQGEPTECANQLPVDPEKLLLMRMTSEILQSKSNCAASLSASIRSFHESISMERDLGVMKDEIRELRGLKDEIAEIKMVIRTTGGRTREGDPPEKKGQIIKKRAISSG